MSTLLRARNIHKSFFSPTQVKVLNAVSLEIAQGETVAIMGRSGEGKSTLLNILGALEKPCEGEIELSGIPVIPTNAASIRNRHIGFIFQAFNLLEDYTTLENVLMPAKIARKAASPKSEAYERGLQLLEKMGLFPRAQFLTRLLSGGEKQRVAIARALCNDPDLILADEPSGNLDHANSALIHDLLIRCAKEYNKSLIVVTHDQELAALCDRILLLKDGTLQCTS